MHKLGVLICDDMDHVRMAHEEAVFQCGKDLFHPVVAEARTGEEAVELVREAVQAGASYDLILMDVDFGQASGARRISGFQAVDQIHHLLPHAVIAMVSAYGNDDNYQIVSKTKYIDRFFRRGEFDLTELKSLCKYALVQGLHQKNSLLSQDK